MKVLVFIKIIEVQYFGEKSKPEEVEEYLTGKKIRCLICGDYFQAVGNHSFVVHGVTAKEYKLEFGIPVKRGLIGSDLKDLKHDLWEKTPGMDARKDIDNDFSENEAAVEKFVSERLIEYLAIVESAIANKTSVYLTYKRSVRIYGFASKYKHPELIERLEFAKQFVHDEHEPINCECIVCGKPMTIFASQKKENGNSCSDNCRHKARIKRYVKNCVICKEEMSLNFSDFNKLVTCGTKECKSKYRSIASKKMWAKKKVINEKTNN